MTRCAVVGAGAWGTALANVLTANGHETLLWARETDVVASINDRRLNDRFLAGIPLSPSLRATGDMGEALAGASLVVYVPPSHALRSVVRAGRDVVAADATVVVARRAH